MKETFTMIVMMGILLGSILLFPESAYGQATDTLPELFTRAVQANGTDYVTLRDAILLRKDDALPFLTLRKDDADWHTSMPAEAMLIRLKNPSLYMGYELRTMAPIWEANRMHGSRHTSLLHSFTRIRVGAGQDRITSKREYYIECIVTGRSQRKASFQESGVPFLLELALKGSLLRHPTVKYDLPEDKPDTTYTLDEVAHFLNVDRELAKRWMALVVIPTSGNITTVTHEQLQRFINAYLLRTSPTLDARYAEAARCWAIATLSDFTDHPAVVPALTELLNSPNESSFIRGFTARSLEMTGDEQVIPILTQALTDPDEFVRTQSKDALDLLREILDRKTNNL